MRPGALKGSQFAMATDPSAPDVASEDEVQPVPSSASAVPQSEPQAVGEFRPRKGLADWAQQKWRAQTAKGSASSDTPKAPRKLRQVYGELSREDKATGQL